MQCTARATYLHCAPAKPLRHLMMNFSHSLWISHITSSTVPREVQPLRPYRSAWTYHATKMLKPSTTRWLALEHSISHVLEQWRALKEFFAKNPSASTKQAKKILKAMQTPSTKAKMLFLQDALPVFTRLNLRLQQEGPMVHRLMDECEQATKTILLNILRPEAVLSATSLASSHLLRQQNFLDITKVTIGAATERYTERVFRSTDSKAEFLELCRGFWVVAAKEAQARLPLKDGVLKAARFLEPHRGNLIDGSTLVSLAEQFPQVIPNDQLDELRRQWQEYQVDDDVSPADDVANFLKHVSGLLTSGSTRYSLVLKLAAAILTIPHSSAGIERNFSQMGAAKTAGRNSISTEILSRLMAIHCYYAVVELVHRSLALKNCQVHYALFTFFLLVISNCLSEAFR